MSLSFRRSWILPLVKGGVSLGLLAVIAGSIDPAALADRLAPVVLVAGLGALAILQIQALGAALRWRLVLRALGERLPWAETWRNVLLGLFVNQVMPSTIGGDAARAWNAWRLGLGLGVAARSLVVDRVFSFAGLIALSLAGLPMVAGRAADPLIGRGLLALVLGGAACLVVLFAVRFVPPSFARWRGIDQAVVLSRAAWAVLGQGGASLGVLGLLLLPHLLDVSVVWLYAAALGLEVGWGELALVVPPAVLVAAVPISVAGWGLREGALVIGFGLIGQPADAALACSLLYGVSAVVTGALGGLVWTLADRDGLAGLIRRAPTARGGAAPGPAPADALTKEGEGDPAPAPRPPSSGRL